MNKPTDYKAIALWGQRLGSYAYYIADEQQRAAEANAPLDAIYEVVKAGGTRTGKWVTIRDLVPDHTVRIQYETAWLGEHHG